MTQEQMEQVYWQRMRRQQVYHTYLAMQANQKNSYTALSTIPGTDWFLNYVEYDGQNMSPDKANAAFKTQPFACTCNGACTGVHKGSMHLRQLDWYYNEEAEFIIRVNKCPENDVLYSSIGVTAASPKMKWQTVKQQIETNAYNPYFDIIPYITVDGVNEHGIFAQSNVVEENGVHTVNINPTSTKDCCCSTMLVRYILDHLSSISDLESYLSTLHLYNAPRDKVAYNNHVLVADALGNTRIIEFKESSFSVVSSFDVMTNFRTTGVSCIGSGANISADWSTIEWNGIGVERFETGMRFANDSASKTLADFKQLRNTLNYTHAYDRPFAAGTTWLTDNLSAELHLSVSEAKAMHQGTLVAERVADFQAAMSYYRDLYDRTSRTDGNQTWITTHGAIYDLANLSCNIQTQQNTCWNVQFDGTISEDVFETKGGKWVLCDQHGQKVTQFEMYVDYEPEGTFRREWAVTGSSTDKVIAELDEESFAWTWTISYDGSSYELIDEQLLHDMTAKKMIVTKSGTAELFTLKWFAQ